MVRIASYVLMFINECRLKRNYSLNKDKVWTGPLLSEAAIWFSAFPTVSLGEIDTCVAQSLPWVYTVTPDKNITPLLKVYSQDLLPGDSLFYEAHTNFVTLQPTVHI